VIALILIVFAGLSWAVMDTIKHHYYESVFKYIKNTFWYCWFHEQGWRGKYNFDSPEMGRKKWNLLFFTPWILEVNKPVQITDAWHFFKMLVLFALLAVPFVHEPLTSQWYWDYLIYGTTFNLSFSLGYNTLFKESLWIFLGLIAGNREG